MAVSDGVEVVHRGEVIEVLLQRRAGNGWLAADQRAALMAELALHRPHARVVLIRAADRVLAQSSEAVPDLPSADDHAAPDVATLCRAVEDCHLPVVMLLDGPVSGAAADLALCATARLASPDAQIGFPAARLARISGAGSTQRLPPLVGAAAALSLLRSGRVVPAAEALAMGLVDHIIDAETHEDLLVAAMDWAVSPAVPTARTASIRDPRGFLAAVTSARAEAADDSLDAALIDCVEAALLLPRDQGLALEATLAAERDARPEVAALAHLHRAEQVAHRVPAELAAVVATAVERPALIGASVALSGLVLTALSRGLPVLLHETNREPLVAMLQSVASRQEAAVQAGTLSAAQRDADWSRLTPVADPAALAQADLLIVAADTPVPPASRRGQPLLVTGRGPLPEAAFRLVLAGRVAELGLPPQCPIHLAAQALAFLRRLGLTVVLTGTQSPLGISGRLGGAGGAAMRALLTMGVSSEAIADALTGFGLTAPKLPTIDTRPEPLRMSQDQILDRWLGAMANEGARLLASGLALSALDIDLVAVQGLGFPRSSGGPLHCADRRGLLILRRDLTAWGSDDPVWTPAPALDAFVSVGRGFSGSLSRG